MHTTLKQERAGKQGSVVLKVDGSAERSDRASGQETVSRNILLGERDRGLWATLEDAALPLNDGVHQPPQQQGEAG